MDLQNLKLGQLPKTLRQLTETLPGQVQFCFFFYALPIHNITILLPFFCWLYNFIFQLLLHFHLVFQNYANFFHFLFNNLNLLLLFFFLLLPLSFFFLLFLLFLLLIYWYFGLQLHNFLSYLLLFFELGLQVPLDPLDHSCRLLELYFPRSELLFHWVETPVQVFQADLNNFAKFFLPPLAIVYLHNREPENLHYSLDLILVQGIFPVDNVYYLFFNKFYSWHSLLLVL